MISKLATDSIRLDQKKPMQTEHRIIQTHATTVDGSGQVRVRSSDYNTRLRKGRVSIEITCVLINYLIRLYNRSFK